MSVTSRASDKAMIRFPPGMKAEIQTRAQAGYRSMNAEIIARLRRDMDQEKTAPEHTA